MDGSLLLDTNIIVAMINDEPAVVALLRGAEKVFVPSVALGELYYGAFWSARRTENVARIDAFARGRAILGCDQTTARCYGEIKSRLRAKGRPIPDNDIWIAAITLQHGLTLLSRDEHFREVEAISLATPATQA